MVNVVLIHNILEIYVSAKSHLANIEDYGPAVGQLINITCVSQTIGG